MSDRTKEDNFSAQIDVGDSESITGLVHQNRESTWNHGSHPKIMTHANMSDRTKENKEQEASHVRKLYNSSHFCLQHISAGACVDSAEDVKLYTANSWSNHLNFRFTHVLGIDCITVYNITSI